jgi:hypothetical protein
MWSPNTIFSSLLSHNGTHLEEYADKIRKFDIKKARDFSEFETSEQAKVSDQVKDIKSSNGSIVASTQYGNVKLYNTDIPFLHDLSTMYLDLETYRDTPDFLVVPTIPIETFKGRTLDQAILEQQQHQLKQNETVKFDLIGEKMRWILSEMGYSTALAPRIARLELYQIRKTLWSRIPWMIVVPLVLVLIAVTLIGIKWYERRRQKRQESNMIVINEKV